MSELDLFLKKNKIKKDNIFYPATASLKDRNGEALKWELKALSARDIEDIKAVCLKEKPVDKSKGVYRPYIDSSFDARICAASVVYPDLENAELQDSYSVSTPHELILEMIDSPGEFNNFMSVVKELCGLQGNINDDIETAKN